MVVRFDFEIFVPYLKQAMVELGHSDWYGERVAVNQPWEYSLGKILAGTNTRLAALEATKTNKEELAQMRSYRDTDDLLIEQWVTHAVAEFLDQGQVVHPCRYVYKGTGGDLDGLVVGRWLGKDVVVLVEAKHNMDTVVKRAQSELFASEKYWKELAGLSRDDLAAADSATVEDYTALRVSEYKQRSVVFAFGGCKFTDEAAGKFKFIKTPWLRVTPNLKGKFVAMMASSGMDPQEA
jgi:hypothetical protein